MKFIYGKQDMKSMERGQENCYLLTNGLGGFSSATMIGSNTRNDHAFLMAGIKAPNHRYNMIHRLSESVRLGKKQLWISSQEFYGHQEREDGFQYLTSFVYEDTPRWLYQTDGLEISKEIGMKQWDNTVAVRYVIENRSREECLFEVVPYMQFTKKGEDLGREQGFHLLDGSVCSNGLQLYYKTNGELEEMLLSYEEYYYAYDACDGRREHGRAAANHKISITVSSGSKEVLELVYSMKPDPEDAFEIIESTKRWREMLEKKAGFRSPVAKLLSKSAGQFVAKRESTGGDTILAGYPFFEDWGRDTMIAVAGCQIATGQYESVKSILRTFLAYQKNGLIPNLFPEGGNEPEYNTVDASLLYIHSVYLYYEQTKDIGFVNEAYPAMAKIIRWYQEGTDYHIRMDEDGLIMAGKGQDQVTWMDIRIGDILPTPRHGKPVEINAYWYNALRIMEQFSEMLGMDGHSFKTMAARTKASFTEKFWMEERHCLKDVISGTNADTQIRCNQIWAVSLPFSILPAELEFQVVETVFEKLYTPYGLRTLSMEDKEFKAFYGGSMLERDLAYHQGTVWVFPLGGYYLAYLKVHGYSSEAKKTVWHQLEVLESALREGCIGQLPEIYDGMNPSSSKGCFAQAWSVGEILRVYKQLEK